MAQPQTKRTNVRRLPRAVAARLGRLRSLMEEVNTRAWAIGDLVNELKEAGVAVGEQAELIGASRQRLSELRRTAAAFAPDQRRLDVDFHFFTVAMRSAKRLGLSPAEIVGELVERRIDSTRAATRYLAAKVRERQAFCRASPAITAGGLWNGCHHEDFRRVMPLLEPHSVKLVIADPPYGRYGKYLDGQHTRVTPSARECDGLDDDSARALTLDLFRLAQRVLSEDGCLVLCRPGGLADPAWLMEAAEGCGWECKHALAWRRGPTKLGDGRAPYTSSTERLMVFARPSTTLVNHDGSSRSDILEVNAKRKSYAALDQHLFEKPVELMELLVGKHTYPQDSVMEPFGGTGPACRAAITMGRRWLYCETNTENFKLGSRIISQALEQQQHRAVA